MPARAPRLGHLGLAGLRCLQRVAQQCDRVLVADTRRGRPALCDPCGAALIQSHMFKLAAIVLQHPSYRLKSLTMANNSRGEIDGNKSSGLGQTYTVAIAPPARIVLCRSHS